MLDQTRKQRRDRQKALVSARREATLSKEELRKIRNRTSAADFRQRTKNELLYLRQRVGKLLVNRFSVFLSIIEQLELENALLRRSISGQNPSHFTNTSAQSEMRLNLINGPACVQV